MSSILILFVQYVLRVSLKNGVRFDLPKKFVQFSPWKKSTILSWNVIQFFIIHTATIEVATFHSSSNENRNWLILRNTSGTIPENSCFLSPPSALVANHLLQQYQGKQCQTNPKVHLCEHTLCQILCLQEHKKFLHK